MKEKEQMEDEVSTKREQNYWNLVGKMLKKGMTKQSRFVLLVQ